MRLSGELYTNFRNHSCEVYPAPFDVRLPNPEYEPGFNNKIHTVVRPDVSVICDPAKIDEFDCVARPTGLSRSLLPRRIKKILTRNSISTNQPVCGNTGLLCRKVGRCTSISWKKAVIPSAMFTNRELKQPRHSSPI